jgi:hypothetical protein
MEPAGLRDAGRPGGLRGTPSDIRDIANAGGR